MAMIPIPVYRSRFTPLTALLKESGECIDWKIGDPAWAIVTSTGARKPVVIRSERNGHPDAPGIPCYDCEFPDGAMYCVPAKRLSIRDGWEPRLS